MPQNAIITWTAVLLALNLAWRTVRYGLAFPIWGDEAFVAVNLFKNDFLDFPQPLDHAQIVPLLFIWVEWGIAKLFGYHELAIRFLPFLAGAVQTLAGATEKEDQWMIFGATTDQPHAPNLFHWGGSAARVRFNVLRYARFPVYWGPAPAIVVKSEGGRTWLIVYRDNKAPMPENLPGRYLKEMAGRFGAPTMDRYRLSNDKEMIFVYPFDNMAANARGS